MRPRTSNILPYFLFALFGIVFSLSFASSSHSGQGPHISIISPLNNVYTTPGVDVKFVTDKASRCSYSFDDSNWERLQSTDGLTHTGAALLSNGNYELIASCIDQSENENYGQKVSFSVQISSGGNNGNTGGNGNNGGGTQLNDHEILLTGCGELSKENTIYYLANNIITSETCFIITANNVTLEAAGFGLQGDGGDGDYGILINGANYSSIKEFSINKFDTGIKAVKSNGTLIDNNVIVNSKYGIMLRGGSQNNLTRNYAYSNAYVGMYIDSSSNNDILDNEFDTNEVGLDLISSHNNNVMYTETSKNDRGILLISSNNNKIHHNSASANVFGIALEIESANNYLYNNTLKDNGNSEMGAGLAIAGFNNIVEKVGIDGSRYDGLYLFEELAMGNIFKNLLITNTVTGQGYDVRFADGSDHFGPSGINDTEFIDSSWDKYYITSTGGRIYIENTSVGSVNFTEPVSGTGRFGDQIKFNYASIFIGRALDSKADLVFYGLPVKEKYQIIKDEKVCSSADCVMTILSAGKLKASVRGAGTYSINLTYNGEDNTPPTVNLNTPVNGETFTATSASIVIKAIANDADGISKVEFYAGNNLLNIDAIAPYEYTWNEVAAGSYSLTAKAYDSLGLATTSSIVNIQVNAPVPNNPPSIILADPMDEETFTAGSAVPLGAIASDFDGIQRVEFYAGTTLILSDNQAPYGGTWVPTDAGTYIITAKAYDNLGASTVSEPVNVIVKSSNTNTQDTLSPQITVALPIKDRAYQFNETGELNFSLQTNEPAYCNYTLDSGKTNQTMNRNSAGTAFISSYLFEEKNRTFVTYHFIADCRDDTGNKNSTDIRFFTNFTARINDSINDSGDNGNTNTGNNGNNNQNNGNQEESQEDLLSLIVSSPKDTAYPSSGIWIQASLDREGTCKYSLDNGKGNITLSTADRLSFSAVHSGLSNGAYDLQVYCSDLIGNRIQNNVSFMIQADLDSQTPKIKANNGEITYSAFDGIAESEYLRRGESYIGQPGNNLQAANQDTSSTEKVRLTTSFTENSLRLKPNNELKGDSNQFLGFSDANNNYFFIVLGMVLFMWLCIALVWLVGE